MSLQAAIPRKEVVLYEWVRLIFEVLAAEGLRYVVLCPGSRNAPLILGALGTSELTCHSVLDERSAGFYALGLARATRQPVAVVCTSGSALAHFLPAVIEAYESSVPLLVVSADRPSHLQSCGAAQTTHQVGMLGSFAQQIQGWDEPSADEERLCQWVRKVAQLYRLCQGPQRGPVHLNIPLDKPLEPMFPLHAVESQLHDEVTRLVAGRTRSEAVQLVPPISSLDGFLSSFFAGSAHRLLSVGPVEPALVPLAQQLAEDLKLPLIAELPSLASEWNVEAFSARFLRTPSATALRILHVGAPLVSSRWARLLNCPGVEQWVVPGPRYLEPSSRAQRVLLGELESTISQLNEVRARQQALPLHAASSGPAASADELPARLDQSYDPLSFLPNDGESGSLSEPRAVAEVLKQAGSGTNLVLGNSLSIRLAGWLRRDRLPQDTAVYSSRGTNGIDGLIAQSSGIAQANGRPTILLLGDVSAAHDAGSLAIARVCPSPLVIVVLDNGGGRIFEHLPGSSLWSTHPGSSEFFLTPPRIDWRALGAAYGIETTECGSIDALSAAISEALHKPGTHLVIAPTNTNATRDLLRLLSGDAA